MNGKWLLWAAATCAASSMFQPALADSGFDPVTWDATLGYDWQDSRRLDLEAIGGRVGARFGRYLGAEGQVDVGVDHHRFVYYPPCTEVCAEPIFLENSRLENSESLYGMGYLPITDGADLFARAGYGFSDYSAGPVLRRGFSEQSFNYGAGGQIFLIGANGIRFDYTRESVTSKNQVGSEATGSQTNVWSVAFVHRF